jgi:hypothetical protein
MAPPSASKRFASVALDQDDEQQCMDLYIALTVLEKLEVSYSKSLLSMEEYEAELHLAIKQCRKAHLLVSHKFPTLDLFVKEFSMSSQVGNSNHRFSSRFQRALVQLEGTNLISTTLPSYVPSFPLSEQTTAAHIIKIFEKCAEIKEVIETYETDSYELAVGRVRDLLNSLMGDLSRLDGQAAVKMRACVEKMRVWQALFKEMESRQRVDSQTLMTDLNECKSNLLDVATAYKV